MGEAKKKGCPLCGRHRCPRCGRGRRAEIALSIAALLLALAGIVLSFETSASLYRSNMILDRIDMQMDRVRRDFSISFEEVIRLSNAIHAHLTADGTEDQQEDPPIGAMAPVSN